MCDGGFLGAPQLLQGLLLGDLEGSYRCSIGYDPLVWDPNYQRVPFRNPLMDLLFGSSRGLGTYRALSAHF